MAKKGRPPGTGRMPEELHIRVPAGFMARTREAAMARGVPLSDLVRIAVLTYIKKEPGHDED